MFAFTWLFRNQAKKTKNLKVPFYFLWIENVFFPIKIMILITLDVQLLDIYQKKIGKCTYSLHFHYNVITGNIHNKLINMHWNFITRNFDNKLQAYLKHHLSVPVKKQTRNVVCWILSNIDFINYISKKRGSISIFHMHG